MNLLEIESIRLRLGGTENKDKKYSQKKRWHILEADYFVRKGVILIYTKRIQAEKYWKENI
jgi:hypothetical protein